MISICKQFSFEAAHFLPYHKGLCRNRHGHSYKLEVEVRGVPKKGKSPQKGMIMDFGILKQIVNETIIDKLDHTDLNENFDNPTAEIMVFKIGSMIREALIAHNTGVCLQRVRLYETATAYAEWRP